MNTTIVICSANRPEVLAETVDSLLRGQSLAPREIIISIFNPQHVLEETSAHPAVRVVLGARQGTCVQRNVAARLVKSQYTLFLDDDVELAPDFIESMERLLAKRRARSLPPAIWLSTVQERTQASIEQRQDRTLRTTREHMPITITGKAKTCSYVQAYSVRCFLMRICHFMGGLRIWILLRTSAATAESS